MRLINAHYLLKMLFIIILISGITHHVFIYLFHSNKHFISFVFFLFQSYLLLVSLDFLHQMHAKPIVIESIPFDNLSFPGHEFPLLQVGMFPTYHLDRSYSSIHTFLDQNQNRYYSYDLSHFSKCQKSSLFLTLFV